jgi:hypothetical protein
MPNIIYTVSVGGGNCFKKCVESQKKYAERIGVDFYCRDKWTDLYNEDLKTDSEKRYIVELLKKYDRVLYLDADVFIQPFAFDIFEWYKDDRKFIIYNEAMYNGVQMDNHIDYCANKYKINWPKTEGHYDWLNAGVMLCSAGMEHEKIFDYNPKNFFKFQNMPMIYDMPYMHKNIYDNNIQVTFMDKRFNTMVYFEQVGFFLHFANVLDRDKRINDYV